MKKRVLAITLLIVMVLTVSAQAITPRYAAAKPSLTFSDRTAICEVGVRADNVSDKISVTLKLWRGASCLDTWTETGTGYVYLTGEHTVPMRSWTYKLTADVTINGVAQPQTSVEAVCP